MISRDSLPMDGVLAPPFGTLGAIVTSRETGNLQLLTCAHVVKVPAQLNIFQPGLGFDGAEIVWTTDKVRQRGSPHDLVHLEPILDCAVIQPNGKRDLEMSVASIGSVQGVSTERPVLGQAVKKRGARTRLTHGFVVGVIQTSLGADHMIVISGGVPGVSVWAGHGDSGSVVMNESDEVIGLNFTIAGEDVGDALGSLGTAMPIHNVQEALQVDIAVGP